MIKCKTCGTLTDEKELDDKIQCVHCRMGFVMPPVSKELSNQIKRKLSQTNQEEK